MATAANSLPLWLINYLSSQGLFRSYYDTAADTLNQFTEQAPVASTTQEFTRSYIQPDSFDPDVDMSPTTGVGTPATGVQAPSLDLNDLAEALGLSSITDALGLTSPDEVDLDTEQASAYSTGYSTSGIGGVADAVIGNPNFSLGEQIGVAMGSLAAPIATNILGPIGSIIGLFGQVANQYGGAYSDLSEATGVSVDPTTGTVSWSTPDNPANFDTGNRAANTIANMPSTMTISMPGIGKVTAQQLQNQIDQFGYNQKSLFGITPESFEDTFGFSRSDLDAFGFATEAEKSAAIAMTDFMSEVPGAFTGLDFSLGPSVAGGRGSVVGPTVDDIDPEPDFDIDAAFGYEDYSESDVSGDGVGDGDMGGFDGGLGY